MSSTPPTPPESAQAGEAAAAPATQYAMYSIFRRDPARPVTLDEGEERAVAELDEVIAGCAQADVTLRGIYDISGFRHDGEVMLWLHGPEARELQAALRRLRRTGLLRTLLPSWQAVGVHRTAEFNARHMPAFMMGKEPRAWLTVYPFVRSYEWYLLPEEERSRMLAEHGRKGAAFRTTLANTIASFGISDYEWLLALEDDELLNLVDMMRDLRQTDARRHVREEVPFYTGRRIDPAELPEVLR